MTLYNEDLSFESFESTEESESFTFDLEPADPAEPCRNKPDPLVALDNFWTQKDRTHIFNFQKHLYPIFGSKDEWDLAWERSTHAAKLIFKAFDIIPSKCPIRSKEPHEYDIQRRYFNFVKQHFQTLRLLMKAYDAHGRHHKLFENEEESELVHDAMQTIYADAGYHNYDKMRTRIYQQLKAWEIEKGEVYSAKRARYDASRLLINRQKYAEMSPEKKAIRAAKNAARHQERKAAKIMKGMH